MKFVGLGLTSNISHISVSSAPLWFVYFLAQFILEELS
jgi:hypothetical protein